MSSVVGSLAAQTQGSDPASWAAHRWHGENVVPYSR
jgi:hypothetical protein